MRPLGAACNGGSEFAPASDQDPGDACGSDIDLKSAPAAGSSLVPAAAASLAPGAAPCLSTAAAAPGISKQATAQAFGRAAQRYDRHAQLQREVAERLLAGAQELGTGRILDLGCGTGYCARRWRELRPGAELVCLDLSPGMLAQARASLGDGAFLCGDAEALPLADASFAGLLSSLAIQWCADLPRLFGELRRVLQPGATCHLSTFGPATLRELREAWARVDGHEHVNHFAGAGDLEAAIQNAGFGELRLERELRQPSYADLRALQAELKGIGAGNRNPGQPRGLTGRARLAQVEALLRQDSGAGAGFRLSWEVFYLRLRA